MAVAHRIVGGAASTDHTRLSGYDEWMRDLLREKPIKASFWTPERDMFLREAHAKGFAYSQIAKVLGTTRCACQHRFRKLPLAGGSHE